MLDNNRNQPIIASKEGGDDFFQGLAQYILSQHTKDEVQKLLDILTSFVEGNGGTD